MRQIRTSGSMSGDGKRGDASVATALVLDSTGAQNDILQPVQPGTLPKPVFWGKCRPEGWRYDRRGTLTLCRKE
jgi:hypothetical protein